MENSDPGTGFKHAGSATLVTRVPPACECKGDHVRVPAVQRVYRRTARKGRVGPFAVSADRERDRED